jgi:hypothetical protein
MPCPAVPAAAAEGGTRLADNPAYASEAADGTANSSAVSAEATAVGAAAGPANGPVAAREAADEAAGAAVGPKDAIGMELASALAGEAALGVPAACAFTGSMSWLPWEWAMLGGVIAGSHKSGVIMTSLP